ncbi:MAG: ATP-binding protein, partial [Rothia sp. (in: high G+C Gram-positive bacteria)]|nr:ATP-binding protein [Rothia sp. (in: high G+C Gram-positive bacteria)]
PTFGVTPPLLVGRDQTIADFKEALEAGIGSPYRALLLTGTRGAGKTVLLNALEDIALEQGWAVISLTARPGIIKELTEVLLPEYLERYGKAGSRIKQANATVLGVGAGFAKHDPAQRNPGLRSQLFQLADIFASQESGLLISMDEVHRSAVDDLRHLTQEIQHAFRQGKNIAFIAAGLPEAVNDLLSDDVLTFLRRAERITLGTVPLSDIEQALEVPAQQHNKTFSAEALSLATKSTQGYPYLIQSIGYETWRAAKDSSEILTGHAELGVQKAKSRIGALVHEPALSALSDVDKSFLRAMAVDDSPSKIAHITERLGVEPQYTNTYRARLLGHEIIFSPRHGYLDFTIPYLREYLREQTS